MKILKFLPTTILILFTISLSGAVITWTGGTGNWDNALNWNPNTVPSSLDDVTISSGYVTIPSSYSADALSVSVANSSVLEIANTGSLQIDSALVHGLAISTGASLLNAGIINIVSPDIFGIQNSTGTFHNLSSGEIYITNAGTSGIKNFGTGAILTNDGLITINETTLGDGIYSESVIVNTINATINIKNTATNGLDSWGGFLTNYGNIIIDSTGDDGMQILGNSFDNFGYVEVSHCYDGNGSNGAMGISASSIKNSSSGSIYIHHAESSAIRTEGDLENSGLIEIYDNSNMGISVVDGTLGNQETGEIRLKNNGSNAISLSLAALENDGLLLFDNNAGHAINAGSGSLSYNNTSGTIVGNGLIIGGSFYDSGSISPGDSIGSLEIFSYRPALPTYAMEIAGSDGAGASNGYDLLTLTFSNNYLLQGTVNITFLGGYTGVSQDTFNLFSIPSGYTGTFTLINFPALPAGLLWETNYSIDGVKFVIDGMITWTGTISEDWTNPSNWDKSTVPTENNDVTIPAGTSYSAHVNSNSTIRSLLVMPGATLVIDQDLTVIQ